MENKRKATIERTLQLLDICQAQCNKPNFNPHKISKHLETDNNSFYYAVKLGMFTKIKRGKYKANKDVYTRNDAVKIIKYARANELAGKEKKQTKSVPKKAVQTNINFNVPEQTHIAFTAQYHIDALEALGYTFDAQYHIDALKALGYTGKIEKKQIIEF